MLVLHLCSVSFLDADIEVYRQLVCRRILGGLNQSCSPLSPCPFNESSPHQWSQAVRHQLRQPQQDLHAEVDVNSSPAAPTAAPSLLQPTCHWGV